MIGDFVSGSEERTVPHSAETDSSQDEVCRASDASKNRWLILCLLVSLLYSCLALRQAFGSEYVIQDDARHHVIWMQSFTDPELFRGDLIAEHFQSLAGPMFSGLYFLAARVGIDVIFFGKILSVVLSGIASVFCYLLCLRLVPAPAAAALCTVIFLQGLWTEDDIASGCARAFFFPLFLPFLYYLSKRKLIPVMVTLVLQGAYPSLLILSEAILVSTLVSFEGGRVKISLKKADCIFVAAGIIAGAIGMLPVLLSSRSFGATVTGAEAMTMPEFHPGGREVYFSPEPFTFWVTGLRSGVFPMDHPPPLICWTGLLLPFLLRPAWFPLSRIVNFEIVSLFARTAILGIGLYLLATVLAFQLYIPNRYSSFGLRMLLCLAAGLAISLVADRLFRKRPNPPFLVPLAVSIIALSPLLFVKGFPNCGYVTGYVPDLYKFLETQPKNTLVASLVPEAANLPSFAKRSVLATKEYGIAFKKDYYSQFKQRMKDTLAAQYSPNISDVQSFNRKYKVTHWLIEESSFNPDYLAKQSAWLVLCFQPEEGIARRFLESGGSSALAKVIDECAVFRGSGGMILLSADKINRIQDSDFGR